MTCWNFRLTTPAPRPRNDCPSTLQSDEDLDKLPRTLADKTLPSDRRARRRILDEMKSDLRVDEKQEAEYLEDLAQRMRL